MDARARHSFPAAERELTIRRTFEAPRALVFKAWTEPQHLARWSCPRGFTFTENSGDLRVGGTFAARMRSPQGSDHRLRGVYREIVPPDRSVHMESYDDYPGDSQVTAVFVEEGGKTTLTATVLYPSREVRDIVLKSGMEHGAAETYDKLAEMLAADRGIERGAGDS